MLATARFQDFPHMLIGYMRVSTSGNRQVLDLQRDALIAAGVDERHLFEDRVTLALRRPLSAYMSNSRSLRVSL
jgi:hypothetical protein